MKQIIINIIVNQEIKIARQYIKVKIFQKNPKLYFNS